MTTRTAEETIADLRATLSRRTATLLHIALISDGEIAEIVAKALGMPVTTNTQQPDTVNEIASSLTAQEARILANLDDLDYGTSESWREVRAKGLIELNMLPGKYWNPTPLGTEVLAALGNREPVSDSAGGKVEAITAREFVEQGYAEKVKRFECAVMLDGSGTIAHINIMETAIDHTSYVAVFTDNWTLYVGADRKLQVNWLPAPLAATPESEEVSGFKPNDRFDRYEESKRLATALGDPFPSYVRWLEDCIDYRDRKAEKLQASLAIANHELEASKQETKGLREALIVARQGLMDVSEFSGIQQGEWGSVQPEYAPTWANEFKALDSIVDRVFNDLKWGIGYGTAIEAFAAEALKPASGAGEEKS